MLAPTAPDKVARCPPTEIASLISQPPLCAEEYEPDDAQDQNGEPGRNRQEREHRRARFGLAYLGRGFDDLAMSLRYHGDLFE